MQLPYKTAQMHAVFSHFEAVGVQPEVHIQIRVVLY